MAQANRTLFTNLRILVALPLVGILLLPAIYGLYKATRPPTLPQSSLPLTPSNAPLLLQSGPKIFREGTIVRVSTWAGLYSPGDTPADTVISIDAGRLGQVLGIANRPRGNRGSAKVIVVHWFAQEWACFPELWRSVEVVAFTNTINPDWLIPLK